MSDYKAQTVQDIMIEAPLTIQPGTTLVDAMTIMREHRIGCLPVINDKGQEGRKELVGIITEMDFLRISARLMERLAKTKNS